MKFRLTAGLLLMASCQLPAATFTVTNTGDSGAGSLRQAILDANGTPGFDTIAFAIPGAGVHTITPAAVLPALSEAALLDGYSQPGASENTAPIATNAVILIELDGSAIGGVGLSVSPNGGATIQGLAINRWGTPVHSFGGGGNVFRGNFVGTDPTGAFAQPNSGGVNAGAPGERVGGTAPGDRNLISGNAACCLNAAIGLGPNGLIQGNLVGTDATGTRAISNGIGILASSAPVTIGGTVSGAGNVISGNGIGIFLSQSNTNHVVFGNRIGTTADGNGPLGNGDGIVMNVGGDTTTIGGFAPGESNVIAFNSASGVIVTTNGGSKNEIRGNSIHDNGGLGIDLGDVGPGFNDPLDADVGVNGLQNYPILQSIEHSAPQGAGSTRILGKFNSAPSTTFDLDFYSNPACAKFPRELAEGEVYLGSSQVTTDAGGNASIDVTLPVETEAGARISATATDSNGNTSEFSQRILFAISPASGPADGGTPFTASGTDFADPTTLTVGGVPADGVTFVNDHSLGGTMPAFPPGTSHDVVASTPDGTTATLVKGWVSDFLDVPSGHQFHSFVVTLVSNGITAGVGGGLYGVDQGTKRQQMAVFLLKAKNGLCYVPPTCSGTFPDVACPSTFADWIEELAAQGITTGCGGGNFCPNNLVTRRQMAVFLLKTKYGSSYVPPACTGVFDDVPCPGAPAVDFIERLAAEQITGGCSAMPPLYCPDNSSTRGQMAVFITKTFGLQ